MLDRKEGIGKRGILLHQLSTRAGRRLATYGKIETQTLVQYGRDAPERRPAWWKVRREVVKDCREYATCLLDMVR